MPTTKVSVHIGVRSAGCRCARETLAGPEKDAQEMEKLARTAGFDVLDTLMGAAATLAALNQVLDRAKQKIDGNGGTLLLTFSGHGCQQFTMGQGRERDGYDETWCFRNEELRDNDVHGLLTRFGRGVRIIIIADSCHSGGLFKADLLNRMTTALPPAWSAQRNLSIGRQMRSGWNPPQKLRRILLPREAEKVQLEASVLLFAGCRDFETAEDGTPNSLFTSKLLKVWRMGNFPNSFVEFFLEVHDVVANEGSKQHPGVALLGRPDAALLHEQPFPKV